MVPALRGSVRPLKTGGLRRARRRGISALSTGAARTWENELGLFILIIVSVVVAQTWHDWRKSSKDWILPEWARGVALGGVLAISLAAATSFASAWIQDPATQWSDALESSVFWPQVGLVAVAGTVIFLMARKRRLPWMLLLAGLVLGAFWIGIAIG